MQRTPLLRPLRDNGATLYVFPSASEDIGLNLDSRTTSVALSHFALLNFPNLPWDGTQLAEHLQNYVMNFETLLLNQENYNYQEFHTVSERVFWHWVNKEIETNFLTNTDRLNVTATEETEVLNNEFYYVEKPEKYENKNRLVQCFGSIDAGNSLSTEFGMFNETYINIPTSYGNGPVIFKQVQDPGETNYIKGKTYTSDGALEGRTGNLDTLKILESSQVLADEGLNYNATDAFEIVKNINELQTALRSKTNKADLSINSYDDINVDEKKQFKDTKCDITSKILEFDFNAILLYYTVYDTEDPNKAPYAVNLFGIIFLNGSTKLSSSEYMYQGLTKRKSYSSFEAGNFFGNSYSFRVNLKTLSVYDNTDSVIMDNTTMSSIYSNDFSDVISNLNRAIDTMNTNVQATITIQDQYMDILRYYSDQNLIIDDISTKVNGFINGSKTSSFNTALLRTNEIRPLTVEDENMIRLTLNRIQGDYIDNAEYQGTTYISPIIITNNNDTFNVPTVYKPILDPPLTALGEFTDSIGRVQDIIDSINVKYYTYAGSVYQKLELPESMMAGYGLNNIYKKFKDYAAELDPEQELSYVNYDGLIMLLITYVQSLKKEIDELKNITDTDNTDNNTNP